MLKAVQDTPHPRSKPWYWTSEAALYLGISSKTLIRWANRGIVRCLRVGSQRRYRAVEVRPQQFVALQKRAAELLGIKPTTLNEMIKRYDIGVRRGRKGAGGEDEEGASAAASYQGDESLKPS